MLHIDRMTRRSLISALPLLSLMAFVEPTEVRADLIPITVATQNLYIGADLGPIFQAQTLTEAIAAAEKAIIDVSLNNFQARATAIATEINNSGAPLLVGLQEASIINVSGIVGTLSLNYTQILLDALAKQGLNYGVAGVNSYTTNLSLGGINANVVDQDVVLRRTDVAGFSTKSTAVTYNADLPVPLITGGSLTIHRGYVDVDATLNGTEFQFIDTHLESDSEPVRLAQVAQLANAIDQDTIPTIVDGDFNANPGSPTYNIMLQAGFTDVPAVLGVTGLTCCQAPDLDNPTSLLRNRFDYIFGKNLDSLIFADLINDTPFEQVRPRWASDHAGVVATVTIEGEATPVVEPSSASIMASAMFLSVLWYGARRKA